MNSLSTRPVVSEFVTPALAGVLFEGIQTMSISTIESVQALIAAREAFTSGSLSGYWSTDSYGDDVYHIKFQGLTIAMWRDGVAQVDGSTPVWGIGIVSEYVDAIKRAWNI